MVQKWLLNIVRFIALTAVLTIYFILVGGGILDLVQKAASGTLLWLLTNLIYNSWQWMQDEQAKEVRDRKKIYISTTLTGTLITLWWALLLFGLITALIREDLPHWVNLILGVLFSAFVIYSRIKNKQKEQAKQQESEISVWQ